MNDRIVSTTKPLPPSVAYPLSLHHPKPNAYIEKAIRRPISAKISSAPLTFISSSSSSSSHAGTRAAVPFLKLVACVV